MQSAGTQRLLGSIRKLHARGVATNNVLAAVCRYFISNCSIGATHYEVSYSVQKKTVRPLFLKVLSSLGYANSKQGNQEVTISYQQKGTETDIAEYVALDLAGSKAGEYRVYVNIQDLNNNQHVIKETLFQLVAPD